MHNNPDPDSIASALMLKTISESRQIKTRIVYGGFLTRSENRAMIAQLAIPVFPYENDEHTAYDLLALVDCQAGASNTVFPANRKPDITFDHHIRELPRCGFFDIDTEVGATATLVLKYLRKLNLPVSKQIATAYCYALISETKDLDRGATKEDIKYFEKLYGLADPVMLSRIRHAKKPIEYYGVLQKALQQYKTVQNVISCILGEVSSPEYISEIADVFIGIDGIDFTIVTGSHDLVNYVSTRTSRENSNVASMLSEAIGKDGDSGGHTMIAAGAFTVAPEILITRFQRVALRIPPNGAKNAY